MTRLLKILLGVVLIVLGGYLIYLWQFYVFTLIKGGLGLFLILVGLITLAVAGE